MISMKAFLGGLLLLTSAYANASDFLCPVPANLQKLSCEGAVKVKNLTELIGYKENLAQKKGKAKDVIIDFDVHSTSLTISTPCKITLAERRSISINGDLCLHADNGANFEEETTLRAHNVRLESNKKVVIENHADIKAENLELLSLGNTDDSRAHIREGAKVDVNNLSLEAYERVSLGANSTYNVLADLKLYSRGDDDASINTNTKIIASTFELQAYEKARIANNVSIKADIAIINGKSCSISNKTTAITASEKMGSCFTQSSPKGLFSVDVTSGFAPLKVTFNASKIKSTNYVWSFGNGDTLATSSAILTYTYTKPGSYTATLKYLHEKKYKNAGSLQITVKERPVLPPVASLTCSNNNLLVNCNALASFDPQGQPLTFTFDYADGFSETNLTGLSSHAYTLPGLYLVKLTVGNLAGLTSNASAQVQPMLPPNVLPNLVLNCSSPKPNSLECDSVGSTDSDGTIVSYQYNFDDGTSDTRADPGKVIHSFSSGGTHQVKLTAVDNDGGVATIQKDVAVSVNSNPIAGFNCSSDKPYQVSCRSTSTDIDVANGVDALTEYSWNLQNQTITSSTNSTLDYNFHSGGDFTISLSVKDSYGGVGTVSKTVTVKDNNPPLANFTCTNTGVQTIHCESTSSDSDGLIASTSWVLDDGSNLSGTSFDHTFLNDQPHAVNLIITDDLGANATATQSIQVIKNQLPTFDITTDVMSGTLPLTVNFQAINVVDVDGTIASYSWDFGDATNPQTANTNSTSHTFTKAGTYNVKLSVTDNNNGVMTKSVTIATSSAINFVVTSDVETGYVPLKVHFDASQSTSPDSSIASLEWFYKGASIGSGAVLDHTFTDIGSLKVDLVATDAFGVKSSTSKIITTTDEPLKYPPEAFFNIYESDTLVDLHAAITRTQFDIKRAYYTIDGNQTVELSEFYPNTINEVDLKTFGEHQIDLTVEDVRGQKATFTHKFTQTQDLSVLAPYTDFSAVQSSVRTVFLYFNRTFNFDEFRGIKSFHIDYGNGETEDTANLYTTHTYPVAGTYQITVKAISSYNTEKSMTHEVTITNDDVAILSPIANFSYRIYDVAQNVSFYNDRSATPNGSIISYLWDFGDGESATGQKVAHFYNPGSYFVTLTVTDSAGLRSSQTQHVVIYQAGTDLAVGIDCSYTKPFVEYTQQCKLFALDKQNQISKVRVIWGDGTANNLSNPQVPEQGQYQANHKFAAVGTYPISLSVLTSRGETKTANTNVTLTNYAPPVVASLYCNVNNLLVSCNALGSYGSAGSPLTYTFDYGDSFTETNTTGISTHAYSSAGLFTVSLKVINGKGEQATAQTQVQTLVPPNQLPIPNLYCYSRAPYILNCNAANSNDFDGTITSFQYAWDDNTNEIQAVSGEISHAFVNGGNHQVILTVTDNDGGVSSVTNSYYVQENHPPVAAIYCSNTGTMKIHCDSNSQDFDFGDLIKEYKWDLGDGHVFTTTLPSIDYTYLKEGTYGISLMVSDSFGATDSTSQYITPQNLPPVANFNCFANGPLSLNCYNDSYDPEGMMMVTEWFVDGEPIQVENSYPFKLSFSNGGVRLISQKLTDVFGAVTTKYQYFTVDENIAPLVNIVCNPSAGYTYQCSSNASDPDGTIVESLWTIDGKTFSGADILYDITNGGDKIITFTAKDNLGKVTTQSITIHVDRPEGILSCTKLSNYKVKCDASASVGKAGSSQLDYKIYFGDDYLVNSQVGEYEFQSSGDKIVKLVIADDLGNKAQTEVIINIAPMHTLPVPFFIEQVELGRIVNFDASKSLLQDRVVLKYEWDFGDGSKEVTAVPKISHSFQENTYYLVTLKITDENGDLASFSKQLFVYDPQVLDPGEQGRVDLMGIDSDNDGIRDDVQRWIQFESKDNLSMRKYLRTIALVYEENFRNLTTLSNISNNFSKLNKLEQCLKLVEPDPVKVDFDNRIFRVAYGNTDLRFNALNAINASFAGKAIDGDMTDSDLKLFCEALP